MYHLHRQKWFPCNLLHSFLYGALCGYIKSTEFCRCRWHTSWGSVNYTLIFQDRLGTKIGADWIPTIVTIFAKRPTFLPSIIFKSELKMSEAGLAILCFGDNFWSPLKFLYRQNNYISVHIPFCHKGNWPSLWHIIGKQSAF